MMLVYVTFPQYLLQYLLQYYTQVKYIFFKSQYWYNTGTNFYTSIVYNTSIPVLRSPSTGDPEAIVRKYTRKEQTRISGKTF